MQLYYITERKQLAKKESQCRERVLQTIAEAAWSGTDYIQLREKDLSARALESLAQQAVRMIRSSGAKTRLLINSRTDIALATGADGVHLTSNDVSPEDVRRIWRDANGPGEPVIAVSCHAEGEIIAAKRAGANLVVFGPVFDKAGTPHEPTGLIQLRKACEHGIPVFALGGVTSENAQLCAQAGAQGAAGIRLFQLGDLKATVAALRSLK